jgi:ASC-1-like (ASCH) protein
MVLNHTYLNKYNNELGRIKETSTYKSFKEYNCNINNREGIINVTIKKPKIEESIDINSNIFKIQTKFRYPIFDIYNSIVIIQ